MMHSNEETKEGEQDMHKDKIKSAVQDALNSLGLQMDH